MTQLQVSENTKEFFESHGVSPSDIPVRNSSSIEYLYLLNDTVSGLYNPPFLAKNDNVAIRLLKDVVLNNDRTVISHPEDFKLYRVGTFDKATGALVGDLLYHVCNVVDLVNRVNSVPDSFNTTSQTPTGFSEN